MRNRLFSSLLICGLSVTAFAADAVRTTTLNTVDLNDAGALASLRQTNPAHYQAVEKILENVTRVPDAAVGKWLEVEFDAKDPHYGLAILTSYPPKKDLSFTLDNTRYRARIVLDNAKAKLIPAKESNLLR